MSALRFTRKVEKLKARVTMKSREKSKTIALL